MGRARRRGAAAPGPVRALPGLLLPGLVNTHCHTPMLLLRGMGGDLPLLRWLHEVMWPAEGRLTASDVRVAMTSGCVELLRSGTTTSVEMYFFTGAVVDAVLTVGSRVLLTPGVIAAPGWDRLGSWEAMRNAISRRIDRDGLRYGPGERVELGYGPHAAYTLPAEALRSVASHAHERGALLHIHLAETLEEDAALRAEHGSVPALLDRLGVFGGRVLAAHCVQLSDDEIRLLAARQVAVAHCPGSNAKLAAGVARVTALRRAGVRVGLGTDGPASGDDLDLWTQARLAGLFARVTSGDAAALTARELLLMATRDGAAAIGRDDLGALDRAAGPTWCTSTSPTPRSSTPRTTTSCCRTWSGRAAPGWCATSGWRATRCWTRASPPESTAPRQPATSAKSPPASTPDPHRHPALPAIPRSGVRPRGRRPNPRESVQIGPRMSRWGPLGGRPRTFEDAWLSECSDAGAVATRVPYERPVRRPAAETPRAAPSRAAPARTGHRRRPR